MRLFDCFTFFNELDLLELRLRELDPLVHRFVLVEAPQTFTGLPKPLHFKQNRDRFARFLPKIIHVELEEFPPGLSSAWDREYISRRAIIRGLNDAGPDDMVLISDVDEIPKPKALAAALPTADRRLTIFESEGFMYYLNVRGDGRSIVQSPRLISMRRLRDPQAVRSIKPRVSKHPVIGPVLDVFSPIIGPLRSWSALGYPLSIRIEPRAAWHFTKMGGAASIRDNLLAYSHTEMATPDKTDLANLATLINGRRSLFDGAPLATAPGSELPAAVQQNPEHWARCLAS
jgi:beta-1,4-mannosyl-glycoprotein beta-1,4-N-acetylglucosaminyltransferase